MRVLGFIDKGLAEGAKLALGGGRPDGFPRGYYVEPTLFTHVDNHMTIAQDPSVCPRCEWRTRSSGRVSTRTPMP